MESRIIASGTASNLPDEIIEYILLWLPVRSLLKFRCVCKFWCCLISSSSFIESHVKNYGKNGSKRIIFMDLFRSKTIHHCSLNSLLTGSVVTSADFGFPGKINGSMEVVGSVDGLICILVNRDFFWLWNPSTRQIKKLQLRSRFYRDTIFLSGFGFDEFNKDYKVVATGRCYDFFAKVYSLKLNSWKSVDVLKGDAAPSDYVGKCVDGKLHWVQTLRPWDRIEILSFDLTKCVWEKMYLLNDCLEGVFSCVGVGGAYLSVQYADMGIGIGIGIDVYKCRRRSRNIVKPYDDTVLCVGPNNIILLLQMKSSKYVVRGNFSKSDGRMIKSDHRKQTYIARRNIKQAWVHHESLVALF